MTGEGDFSTSKSILGFQLFLWGLGRGGPSALNCSAQLMLLHPSKAKERSLQEKAASLRVQQPGGPYPGAGAKGEGLVGHPSPLTLLAVGKEQERGKNRSFQPKSKQDPSPSDKIGCRSGPRPPVPLCPWEMATAVMDYWMLLWNLPLPCRDTPNVLGHHFFQEKPTPSPQCPPRAQVSSSCVHVFPGRRIRAAGCPPNSQPGCPWGAWSWNWAAPHRVPHSLPVPPVRRAHTESGCGCSIPERAQARLEGARSSLG